MKLAMYKATEPGIYGIFDRLVRWWTRGPYSHCELVFDHSGPDTPALCASASLPDGGVRFKRITLDPSHWDIIEIGNAGRADALDWFVRHEGCAYDIQGLFGLIVWRIGHRRGKFFCSEAVAEALDIPRANKITPNSLYGMYR